jgi:hypothetical protein
MKMFNRSWIHYTTLQRPILACFVFGGGIGTLQQVVKEEKLSRFGNPFLT